MSKYKLREVVFVIGDRCVVRKHVDTIIEKVSGFNYGLIRTFAMFRSNQPEFFLEKDVFASEEEAKAAFFNTEVTE